MFRQFRQRGCVVLSVKESWLNGSPEVQDILIAFVGLMAERESARRGERIRNGLARRRRERAHLARCGISPGQLGDEEAIGISTGTILVHLARVEHDYA